MNFKRELIQEDLSVFKENGFLIIPNFINKDIINEIKIDINPWLKKASSNNRFSSSIIGNNQWIDHLGLCSRTAIKLALDEKIINFLEKYFNDQIILGACHYQRKILPEKKGIAMHSDKGKGIWFFIYLNSIDINTGATRYLPKTHKISLDKLNNKNLVLFSDATDGGGGADYLDINNSIIEKKFKDAVHVKGGSGTAVFFNPHIWHDVPSFSKARREMLWFKYLPKKINNEAVDHLYKQSILSDLSKKQLDTYCINTKTNMIQGLTRFGSDNMIYHHASPSHATKRTKFRNLRMTAYYFRFLLLSLFKKI